MDIVVPRSRATRGKISNLNQTFKVTADAETDDPSPVYRHLAAARGALAPFGERAAIMDDLLDYLDVKTLKARHRHR